MNFTLTIGNLLSILVALGSAVLVVWQGGRFVGRLEAVAKEVHGAMEVWKEDRRRLEDVKLHEQRISQVENTLERFGERLEAAWRKLFSHDKHIAVVKRDVSGHDIDLTKDDSEPPPKG